MASLKNLSDKELEAQLTKLGHEREKSDKGFRTQMVAIKAEQNRRAAIADNGKGPE